MEETEEGEENLDVGERLDPGEETLGDPERHTELGLRVHRLEGEPGHLASYLSTP